MGWSCGVRARVVGNVSDRGLGVRVLVCAGGRCTRVVSKFGDTREVIGVVIRVCFPVVKERLGAITVRVSIFIDVISFLSLGIDTLRE